MNKRQQAVLCVATLGGLLFGLFPPWTYTTDLTFNRTTDRSSRPAGYAFIVTPPEPAPNPFGSGRFGQVGSGVSLDASRLGVQYVMLAFITTALLLVFKGHPLAAGVDPATQHVAEQPKGPEPAKLVPPPPRSGKRMRLSASLRLHPLTQEQSGWAVLVLFTVAMVAAILKGDPQSGQTAVGGMVPQADRRRMDSGRATQYDLDLIRAGQMQSATEQQGAIRNIVHPVIRDMLLLPVAAVELVTSPQSGIGQGARDVRDGLTTTLHTDSDGWSGTLGNFLGSFVSAFVGLGALSWLAAYGAWTLTRKNAAATAVRASNANFD